MVDPRWATFDCCGTLVDWNAGIGVELARLFGSSLGEALRRRYHAIEPRVQTENSMWSSREVMAAELAAGAEVEVAAGEGGALGRSLPAWPMFEEVPGELAEASRRGWRLVALSNSDRDLIDASIRAMGVPFDDAIVASEIGSYKPAHGHWRAFYESTGADGDPHVHVAQSHFHDIVPAIELGIRSTWISASGSEASGRRRGSCPISWGSLTCSTSSFRSKRRRAAARQVAKSTLSGAHRLAAATT